MMSSKKGYSLEQVDDPGYGLPVGIKCGSSTVVADTPQPADYPTDLSTFTPPKAAKISDEEFVEKWMSCDSYVVMSFNVGMTISAVQARATRLRKAGVQLPSFTRATRKTKEVNVTGLNNMIESANYETMTKGEPANE